MRGDRTQAQFPPVPRAAGIEGFALVEFGVTPDGETVDALVLESSPPLVFDGAALRAVRTWKYARNAASKLSPDGVTRQRIRISFVTTSGSSPGNSSFSDSNASVFSNSEPEPEPESPSTPVESAPRGKRPPSIGGVPKPPTVDPEPLQ